MSFKGTTNRSHLRVIREVVAIGGKVSCAAARDQIVYTYNALKTHDPTMVELLVDCVRNPTYLDWEVNGQIQKIKGDIVEYSKNPQHLLLEAIQSAGYSGPYANSLMATVSSVDRLNGSMLEGFVSNHFYLTYPTLPAPEVPKPVYVGGDYRNQADSGVTLLALAFELTGGWLKPKEAMTLTILQMLMGGGGSISAGGPGKGMYSRLFDQVQLDRAKLSTKFAILMNLESRMVASKDIARQIFTYGERKPMEFFLKAVDQVSVKDITNIAQKLLSTPLKMESYGDVLYLPSYDAVSSKFHL